MPKDRKKTYSDRQSQAARLKRQPKKKPRETAPLPGRAVVPIPGAGV